jgi:hypothetical protein
MQTYAHNEGDVEWNRDSAHGQIQRPGPGALICGLPIHIIN